MFDLENFDLFKFYEIQEGSILLSYKGPMDEYVIHSFGMFIREITINNSDSRKNFFKAYMELIQNVSFYSIETRSVEGHKKVGIGSIVIYKLGEDLFLNIGNKVKNEQINPIIEKCEAINGMDRHELRAFKRNERAKPYSSEGGGNIGLIQVALSSKNPLDIKLTPLENDISFFAVRVKINNMLKD